MFQSISAVTFSAPEFEASCNALESLFDYRCIEARHVTGELAGFWGAPDASGARLAVFAPASNEATFIRLVEQPAVCGYSPLQTYGWNAAELHVSNVYGVADAVSGSAFQILGGPRDLLQNGSAIALQVLGPSQEVIYLTQINGENMQRTYGKAECRVGRLFIAVLGVSDHESSRRFYAPLTEGTPRPRRFPIRVLAAAHGLDPLETRFTIGSAVLEEQFRIEIDAYPKTATSRPVTEGQLLPGLCMVSFNTATLLSRPYEPVRSTEGFDMAPYFGRTAQMLYGPDGECIELIAASG